MNKTLFIILAAGKGTRMRSALPKVFHPVAKRPMVEYSIELAEQLGANKIITVLYPEMEKLADLSFIKSHSAIAYQKEQKGTADATHIALLSLKGDEKFDEVFILYGDTPLLTKETLEALAHKRRSENAAIALTAMRIKGPNQYGRLKLAVDNQAHIEDIIEYKDANKQDRAIELCNGGVVTLSFEALKKHLSAVKNDNVGGEYYLTELTPIGHCSGDRTVYIEVSEEEVWGVNRRTDLARVESIMQKRLRRKHMDGGATLEDPKSTYFAYDTIIGKDVTIEPNVYFGAGVVIADNVHIKAGSHLEGCNIGKGVKIGPFARIRPGTEIGDEAAIGNFVELKNAKIGAGVKAGHLSYIGDSVIGSKSNIGAGVITCNYDGVRKHQTSIGSNVFIGSNSALIAPVTIGNDALIGAGSVITKNVDRDEIAIARERQKNLKKRKKLG